MSPALWLDASDESTLTLDVSNNVEQWDDKSGNANHATQTTSGNRPEKVTNAIDIAAGEFLTVPLFAEEETKHNYFFVADCDSSVVNASIWGGSNDSYILIITTSTLTSLLRANGSNNPAGAEVLINGEEEQTVTTRTSLKAVIVGVGKILLVVTNFTRLTSDQELGRGGGSDTWTWIGEVNEVVVIEGDLSLADRQRVEGYLANKWGLEGSLPAGHPYAPTTTTSTTTSTTSTSTTSTTGSTTTTTSTTVGGLGPELSDGNYDNRYIDATSGCNYFNDADARTTTEISVTAGTVYRFSGGNRCRLIWVRSTGSILSCSDEGNTGDARDVTSPADAAGVFYYYSYNDPPFTDQSVREVY